MKNGVLVYPGWKQNLYMKFLYQNQNNISFSSHHGALFSLNRNFDSSQHKILHLHWTADLFAFNQKSCILFFIRFLISLIDILWLKYMRKARVVWTVHNLYAHECMHFETEKFGRRLLGKLSDKVIVHGERAIPLIEKEFEISAEKIEVIYHGDFMAAFPNTISKPEARKLLNISSDKKVYLFFGGVMQYKGAEHLVNAFNQINDEKILLVISGKKADVLKPLVQNNKNILLQDGFIADDRMQIYMNAADWVVLPYKRILTSASLITAMGFKKAVIIPDMGTLPDYMNEDGGIIYNPQQKDSLHSALLKSREMDAEAAGEKNYNRILNFTWEPIIAKTQNLYTSLINER